MYQRNKKRKFIYVQISCFILFARAIFSNRNKCYRDNGTTIVRNYLKCLSVPVVVTLSWHLRIHYNIIVSTIWLILYSFR